MAVLKQTSPTACPVAPKPSPSITVPSASTRRAVGAGSVQPGFDLLESSCRLVMRPLDSGDRRRRQSAMCASRTAFAVPCPNLYLSRTANEVTMLRDDINSALKDAMKAKDGRRVSTLRLVNATLKNADIEARGQGKGPLGDDAVLGVLQKMIKQRHESVELYEKGGRAELAQQERDEIAIITAYLPKQMSEDEVKAAIAQAMHDVGAAGMKDMGKVVGALKGKYAGKMDFAKASALVKAALSEIGRAPSELQSHLNL